MKPCGSVFSWPLKPEFFVNKYHMCRISPRIGGRFGWGEFKSACILIKSAVSDKRGVGWNSMG